MTAPITLSNLNHWFGSLHALKDVSLEIEAGEYVTLLGPSGCGKTTLLSVMGGFVDPTEGKILIGGRDMTNVPPAKRPTTTMFQDYALFPHMNLRDNVSFGLRMSGMGRRERHDRAKDLLELVGLFAEAGKRPHELSGGQRQRVALARALAVEPNVLLLDEPLGALDLKLRRTMQDELKTIQRKVGTTFIHVTHDQEEAMAIADRIVVMNEGRIEDQGTPTRIYCEPATLFAADFMGEMNHIPGRGTASGVETPFGILPLVAKEQDPAVVCLRPEAIGTGKGDVSLGPATVRDAAFFGTFCRAHLIPKADPDRVLIAHLPPASLLAAGDELILYTKAEDFRIFDVKE